MLLSYLLPLVAKRICILPLRWRNRIADCIIVLAFGHSDTVDSQIYLHALFRDLSGPLIHVRLSQPQHAHQGRCEPQSSVEGREFSGPLELRLL